MEFDGFVRKTRNSKFWLIHLPALDLMTQGTSKDNAFDMLEDAILELVHSYFGYNAKRARKLSIIRDEGSGFGVSANNSKLLLSLALRRQREMSGATVREASNGLKSKSPNAYAQYERGNINISLDTYERLLRAANPSTNCSVRIG